ncbi:MAG: hypothetical protein EP338_08895 [Bacteroidetes bacterium]|nr:MAG: hypothetical protein EP338_08895 [Bacteroidota bacterium]
MSTLSQEQKAFEAEEGKLMKFLKKVKKALSKEFLYLLTILLISLPLSYFALSLFQKKAPNFVMALQKSFPGTSLYLIFLLGCGAGLYFSRMVLGAVQSATKPKSGSS